MTPLNPDRLLTVWEAGAHRHPLDRALLLLALAEPDTAPERLADVPLGARNTALMRLRRARYGDRLDAWVDCPACDERMEFELDAAHLPDPTTPPPTISVEGLDFRPPTTRQLAALLGSEDQEHAAGALLEACAERPEALPREAAARAGLLEAVERELEEVDPWADLSLMVLCPSCGHKDVAALDIAGLLWDEVAGEARRLLDEVHVLAQAYGWSQSEVLGLSDARRAAYLDRVLS